MRRHRPDTTGVIRLISTSRGLGYARVRVEVARQLEAEYPRDSGWVSERCYRLQGCKHVTTGGIYGGIPRFFRRINLFKTSI